MQQPIPSPEKPLSPLMISWDGMGTVLASCYPRRRLRVVKGAPIAPVFLTLHPIPPLCDTKPFCGLRGVTQSPVRFSRPSRHDGSWVGDICIVASASASAYNCWISLSTRVLAPLSPHWIHCVVMGVSGTLDISPGSLLSDHHRRQIHDIVNHQSPLSAPSKPPSSTTGSAIILAF